jgi:hypothetical protein
LLISRPASSGAANGQHQCSRTLMGALCLACADGMRVEDQRTASLTCS